MVIAAITRDAWVVIFAIVVIAGVVAWRLAKGDGWQEFCTNLRGPQTKWLSGIFDLLFKMAGLLAALVAANFFVLGPSVGVTLKQRQLVQLSAVEAAYRAANDPQPTFVAPAVKRLGANATPEETATFALLAHTSSAPTPVAAATTTTAAPTTLVPSRGFDRGQTSLSKILNDRCQQVAGTTCNALLGVGTVSGLITPVSSGATSDDLDTQALCSVRSDLIDLLAPNACEDGTEVPITSRALVLEAALAGAHLDATTGQQLRVADARLAAARFAEEDLDITNDGRSAATGVRIVPPTGWATNDGCRIGGHQRATAGPAAAFGLREFKSAGTVPCGGFSLQPGKEVQASFVTAPGAPPLADVSVDPGGQTGLVATPLVRTILFVIGAVFVIVVVNDLLTKREA
ncbi:MAG: hypothetical protein ACYDH6_08925 [Acidimicrobiales bacterium]